MASVKTSSPTFSNIVKKKQLRAVQQDTLDTLKQSLMLSAGPYGSTTGIIRNGEFTEYTKDGHTILSGIKFNKSIEASIQQELAELTRYIVVKVGDGTTSAVILSSLIFDELCAMEADTKIPPYKIISEFKKVVAELKKMISEKRRDLTLEDVYNIAMICTNSNEDISDVLLQIYKKHGLEVFIDVNVSTTHNNIVKSYDGVTLEAGYSDPAYINTAGKSSGDAGYSIIRNAHIYAFQDPIDTIEMVNFFIQIISENVMTPINMYSKTQDDSYLEQIKPTVIIAPKISIDNASTITDLISYMYQYGPDNLDAKPPILVITNVNSVDYEIYSDIWRLCGCKPIKKYIDPAIQKRDIEDGKAPTPETISAFCGFADEVKSDAYKTTFINPKDMFVVSADEDGERTYSPVYQTQLNFLEQELKKSEEENGEIDVIYSLKRRIHSLKANMVDYLIGGATVTDRDSVRALVEDAVKNIRSAAQNGVGYGANYEGLRASYRYLFFNGTMESEIRENIAGVIYNAYKKLSIMLYETAMNEGDAKDYVEQSLEKDCGPINLTTGPDFKFDGKVLSTIDSDITILDVISKIITVMFTTNQMLVQTPQHNMYIDTENL